MKMMSIMTLRQCFLRSKFLFDQQRKAKLAHESFIGGLTVQSPLHNCCVVLSIDSRSQHWALCGLLQPAPPTGLVQGHIPSVTWHLEGQVLAGETECRVWQPSLLKWLVGGSFVTRRGLRLHYTRTKIRFYICSGCMASGCPDSFMFMFCWPFLQNSHKSNQ